MAYLSHNEIMANERTRTEARLLRQAAKRTANNRNGWADVRTVARDLAITGLVAWATYMATTSIGGVWDSLAHRHSAVVAEAGR